MKVPGVETEQFLPCYRVSKIELMRTDDVAFGTNSKQLALDRIEQIAWVYRIAENRIERFE